MSKFPTHVVLSPHPDDAVLSLGACISAWVERNIPVRVVTCFDGPAPFGDPTPAAIEDAARYQGDPVALRRAEDRDAIHFLGAELISLQLPELVHRRRHDGTPRCSTLEDIFGPLDGDDDEIIDRLASALRAQWSTPGGMMFHVPLATGGHSDHRIVRAAIERLQTAGWGGSFEYYDDMPYAWREATHDPTIIWPDVDDADIDRWIEAIRLYPSQMSTLFAEDPRWEHHFREWSKFKRR